MSSLYDKAQKKKTREQEWKSSRWDDDKMSFVMSEFSIPDFRDLHLREDSEGNRILPSQDDSCEQICFSVTKASSGASLAAAVKDKRAVPIMVKGGLNWCRSYEMSKYWEAALVLDIPENAVPELSELLMNFYNKWGLSRTSRLAQ